MNLLILGGTRFIGQHLARSALAQGHGVTLFNRGQQAAQTDPRLETIQGDRHLDLGRLANRQWDAVIDTCGYLPSAVAASASALAQSVKHYVFISSISVYADFSAMGATEDAALIQLTPGQLTAANAIRPTGPVSATTYGELYGGLKVLCEQAANNAMPGRVLVLRPGLVVGSGDYSDRFTYWVNRVAQGGEVLVPGEPLRQLQLIDAADLARWTIRLVEQEVVGAFNATCAPTQLTMAGLLNACRRVAHSDAKFTWVDDGFLLAEGVAPWSELPLWIPASMTEMRGFMQFDDAKASAAGLATRPIEETIGDVLAWARNRDPELPLKAGLTADTEAKLLKKWRQSR